jgi:long-chain acyl-CoA synthetase
VVVTSRQKDGELLSNARARIAAMVAELAPDVSAQRMEVVFADVTSDGLGLSSEARARIFGEGTVQIVHGAAEVRFDLPFDVMELQNVGGTKNVLALCTELAERGKLVRFEHVSTTYVAGDRRDVALETELDAGQSFRNDYERTKLMAELEVRRAMEAGLPATVHRPSIIVGDSRTGRASSFKVLYWPMKVYARGRWRTVFGRRDCTVDVVPVDYVADAMLALMQRPDATGRTFHLAAGVERQATIEELVTMAQEIFAQKPVRYLDPDVYMRWIRPWLLPILRMVRPDVANRGGVYLPYLAYNPSFSTTEAQAVLQMQAPRVVDYFGTIMRYAMRSDFGRREFELPTGSGP